MPRDEPSVRHNRRRPLIASGAITADELIARHELPPSGDIASAKLVITFAGAFEFQVGRSVAWVDSARLLFAFPGEHYADRHLVPGVGHASVILSPDEAIVDELWGRRPTGRVRGCTTAVQRMAQLLRRTIDPLGAAELAIGIVEGAMTAEQRPPADDQRCVRRAKRALHECVDGRLTLEGLAAEIGVSPVHLTQCFRRSEGMPLYRYQGLLRMTRALQRLPDRDDITALAFELGYSSHSHFTATFRAHTGMTPSAWRSQVRAASSR